MIASSYKVLPQSIPPLPLLQGHWFLNFWINPHHLTIVILHYAEWNITLLYTVHYEAGMGERKLGIEQHPVSAYVAAKELLSQKQRAEQW